MLLSVFDVSNTYYAAEIHSTTFTKIAFIIAPYDNTTISIDSKQSDKGASLFKF